MLYGWSPVCCMVGGPVCCRVGGTFHANYCDGPLTRHLSTFEMPFKNSCVYAWFVYSSVAASWLNLLLFITSYGVHRPFYAKSKESMMVSNGGYKNRMASDAARDTAACAACAACAAPPGPSTLQAPPPARVARMLTCVSTCACILGSRGAGCWCWCVHGVYIGVCCPPRHPLHCPGDRVLVLVERKRI